MLIRWLNQIQIICSIILVVLSLSKGGGILVNLVVYKPLGFLNQYKHVKLRYGMEVWWLGGVRSFRKGVITAHFHWDITTSLVMERKKRWASQGSDNKWRNKPGEPRGNPSKPTELVFRSHRIMYYPRLERGIKKVEQVNFNGRGMQSLSVETDA